MIVGWLLIEDIVGHSGAGMAKKTAGKEDSWDKRYNSLYNDNFPTAFITVFIMIISRRKEDSLSVITVFIMIISRQLKKLQRTK